MKYFFSFFIIFTFSMHAMNIQIRSRINREYFHDKEKQVITFAANMILENKEYLVEVTKTMPAEQSPFYPNKASWKGYKLFCSQDEKGQWHDRRDELPFSTTTDLFMILSGAYAYHQFKLMHPNLD